MARTHYNTPKMGKGVISTKVKLIKPYYMLLFKYFEYNTQPNYFQIIRREWKNYEIAT